MITLNERFQQQLDEANKPGSSTVFAWVKQHAPRQYELLKGGEARFFRGVQGTHNSASKSVIMTAPSKYRPAKNTGDMYKVLLDACNPDWPRRGWSTVVTTDVHQAGYYGTPVIIIPPDSTIVGCVNKEDLHDTGVIYFNLATADVMNILEAKIDQIVRSAMKANPPPSFVAMKKADERVQLTLHNGEIARTRSDIDKRMMEYGARLRDVLVETKMSQSFRDKLIDDCKSKAMIAGNIMPPAGWILHIVKTLTVQPFIETIKNSPVMKYEGHGCSKDPASYEDVSGGSECWFEGPYAVLQFNENDDVPIPRG